jgi:hypothetical protein
MTLVRAELVALPEVERIDVPVAGSIRTAYKGKLPMKARLTTTFVDEHGMATDCEVEVTATTPFMLQTRAATEAERAAADAVARLLQDA